MPTDTQFDVAGARKAGYSDGEIVDYLGKSKGFNVDGARKAGYSDIELLDHLGYPSEAAQAAGAPKPHIPHVDMHPEESNVSKVVTGPPLTGMESGLSSPAQTPENAHRMQQGAEIGSLATAPAATLGAMGGSYVGGKVGKTGAKVAGLGEKGQEYAEAGGKLLGGAGGAAVGHFVPAADLIEWGRALTSPTRLAGKLADVFIERMAKRSAAGAASEASASRSSVPEPPKSVIVSPDSPPPPVPVTYQSIPRAKLYQMAKKGDLLAGRELMRSPGEFPLPPNFKYLIEGASKRIPWRAPEQ
jgi:hypothetical protein